jgi:hypothetical protein
MSFNVAFLPISALVQGASGANCVMEGGFTINGNTLQCNAASEQDLDGFVEVSGSGSGESTIRDAMATILLRGISSSSPLKISGSDVTLLFDGTTEFGGIFCEDESNVTLAGLEGGSLNTIAASGPGLGAPAGSLCNQLTIVNGSIRAQGVGGSAGIGTAATVNVNSAIGVSATVNVKSRIRNLRIENANVIGSSSTSGIYGGSGIGTGCAATDGDSRIGNMTIANANVTGNSSTSGNFGGSGIGTGCADITGDSGIGNMTIANANVTGNSRTIGNYGGSGIGTGTCSGAGANSGIGNMTIANANVTGNSSTSENYGGSGIGTGCDISDGRNLGIGNMTIANANVTGNSSTSGNYGGSGIGSGFASNRGKSDIGRLVLSGTLTLICDGLRAGTVVISNAWIFTQNSRLFETTPALSGRGLVIVYGTAATHALESFGGIPYLSIGTLSLPSAGGWGFCVSGGVCSPSEFRERDICGLFVLVADEGSYSIFVEGPSRGSLGRTEFDNRFPVSANGSFFPVAYFIQPSPTPSSSKAFVESALLSISMAPTSSGAFGQSGLLPNSMTPISSEAFEKSAFLSISMTPPSSEAFGQSALLPFSMTPTSSGAFEKSTLLSISRPIVGSSQLTESGRYLESGEFRLISSSASPIKGLLMTVGLIGALLVLLLIPGIFVWSYVHRSREQLTWSAQSCAIIQDDSSNFDTGTEFTEQENPILEVDFGNGTDACFESSNPE